MDKDDDKSKMIIFSTPTGEDSFFYSKYIKQMQKGFKLRPGFIGVDWAKDSGMNRGDVYERDSNVIHVRFKTVEIDKDGKFI